MDELIEKVRGSLYACNAIRGYLDDAGFPDGGNAHGQLAEIEAALTEAAAALEAAREDAERWRAARRMLSDPMFTSDKFADAVCSRNAKAIDAAIDQARGKAGGEVEGG